jgi:3-oxoadipate enol-lactonase
MEVNGKAIAVDIFGDGTPILMIHGLGGTSNVWCAQREALARNFRVICPDLEGSGRSPLIGHLSIDGFVADMTTLLETLNISSAHVAGYSLGTVICQHLAVKYPERVRSLVLLGPIAAPSERARNGLLERARNVRTNGLSAVADALIQTALSTTTRATNPGLVAFLRESVMRQSVEGYARTCEALAEAKPADLDRIQCPALLITGDEDQTAPPQQSHLLAKAIARSEFILLSSVAHMTPLERPREVNQAMLKFYLNN